MSKIQLKKPNIKGVISKLKSLRWADVKEAHRKFRAWRGAKAEAFQNSAVGKKLQEAYHRMNQVSLILHGIWAILINFTIEAMSRHSFVAAWEFSRVSTKAFLYNAFMIFVTFSIVYLFKRRVFMRVILTILWLVLGAVNGIMLSRRVTPFNAQDLKTVAEGLSLFTNYFSVLELVGIGLGVVLAILFLIYLWKTVGKYKEKVNYLLSAIVVAVSFGGYGVLTDYVIENRIVSTYFANIAFAYQDYGLPYCFAASIFNTGISEPNGYTERNMAEITNDGKMAETVTEADVLPNVVFVQLESFFDTSEFEALKTTIDPLPNLRKMAEEYSSGYCEVPSIGAGTANTEFEVITGMNLRYFGPGEYPYKTYLKTKTAESAATAFKSLGYGAHAIHNHSGNFYSRAKVFNNTGFDTFVCKEFMNFDTTPGGWAKDEVLLTHIEDCLNSTEQQDFVFTITVQGHGSYPEKKVVKDPHVYVWGLDTPGKNNQWAYYVNQVYEMDIFAQNLVDMMDDRGEPAVVVFYGDHLPTMGLQESDMKSGSLFNTNYVIWDNIGLEKKDGTIPTYQLMAEVMDRLGIHAGTVFNYHQERKAEDDPEYLMDLELLQYDLLYGEKYVYGGEPLVIEGGIEMGVRDAEILYLSESLEGDYTIVGENFTKWSHVYINGEKQSRRFINENTIKLTKSNLKEWDVVTISYVGSSNTIFRTSEEYVYLNGRLVQYTDELKAEKALLDKESNPVKRSLGELNRL